MRKARRQPAATRRDLSNPDPADAVGLIRRSCPKVPELAIVLGSGFSAVAQAVSASTVLSYDRIPGFPVPTVTGHPGQLIVGELLGTPVILLAGRAHYYEGYDLAAVTFPIRVLAALGVGTVLLTNAAGCINRRFKPGEFMVVTDHINFLGSNPLRGIELPEDQRFVDLSAVYDAELQRCLHAAGRVTGIRLQKGVYLAVSGPSYETPAEIRAFARLGAEAIGMSTVAEAIVARQCRLRVAGLSCLTNLAAGLNPQTITHQEVLETCRKSHAQMARLLGAFARLCGVTR